MRCKSWLETTWGEISTLEYGKRLTGYKEKSTGYPVFGTNGQVGYTEKPLCNTAGVIIGRKGAYRGVHYSNDPFYVIDTAFYLKPKNDKELDLKWAYYFLLTQDINRLDSGSAIPSTSRGDFYSLTVFLPPTNEQVRIADFLSKIDEKIKLNDVISKNLEEIAQTLFKRWFLDFEFPNEEGQPYKSSGGKFVESEMGIIPHKWSPGKLGDIADIIMGQSPKGETYNTEGIGLGLVNGASDFKDGKINPLKYTTDPKKVSIEGDWIFGVRATVGNVTYVDKEYCLGRGVGVARTQDQLYREFIYFQIMRGIDYLSATSMGSVYINLKKSDIEGMKLLIPTNEIINRFHDVTRPMFEKLKEIICENQLLTLFRDTLLPKLISGEIRIPEAEKGVEECLQKSN